jgi:hypothetical protein
MKFEEEDVLRLAKVTYIKPKPRVAKTQVGRSSHSTAESKTLQ